jgi:class 3 adenylate cyclase
LLSGQIAVSINNSILYENLEQKVMDRTEEVVRQKDIIEHERQQSEKLLLNILPAETAAELKLTGKAQPQRFENVTVLFTDFVGFSKISEQLNPDVLLEALGFYFAAFDEITSRYGLEKIKTIGDSYMCAGGLPLPDDRNTEKTVAAAIEIRDFMLKTKKERIAAEKPVFDCRIGVHTGPVIAGIIGTKKFAYDIWGNTVNIASRMESYGEINKVNLSGETYELIKDKFEFTFRGKIELKHEQFIDMYYC